MRIKTIDRALDLAGIGIGPFNLSLAALLDRVEGLDVRFFEQRPDFAWHPGLMFDTATLQSPCLKDLVTPVDPTNPYSFLNYLVREHRLYRFIVASYTNVPRREFNRYFAWASRQIRSLYFDAPIERIDFDGAAFVLEGNRQRYRSRNLALGIGRAPNIPEQAQPHLCDTVFHGPEYLNRHIKKQGKRIIVIGGGQTGAEIFHDLISDRRELPDAVTWVTRRHNFVPFDESPFTNELYVPGYTKFFYQQPESYRAALLEKQKYSSDAILQPLLLDIYRRLYEFNCLESRRLEYRLLADRRLAGIERNGPGWAVLTEGAAARETILGDVVILATGFRYCMPEMLSPLAGRIARDSQGYFRLHEDFSLMWDGPPDNRIYAHNAGLRSHGWIDPNFAGIAWRSAVIVNSLLGRDEYDLRDNSTAVDWMGGDQVERDWAGEALGKTDFACAEGE